MDLQARCKFPYFTGLPRDLSETAFNFHTDEDPEGPQDFDDLAETLQTGFWRFVSSSTTTIDTYLSTVIDRSACTIELREITNLSTGTMSPPLIYSVTVDGADTSGDFNLPLEVALVATNVAGSETGVDPRSTRGRNYLGPFVGAAATPGDTEFPSPVSDLVSTVAEAQQNLLVDLAADTIWTWCVWSRKEAAMFPVIAGWVDDEWDTQRRREVDASSRISWP